MVDRHSSGNSYSSSSNYNNPSFSSTLLDAIYRSIETETAADNYKDPMIRMKHNHDVSRECRNNIFFKSEEEDVANYQRACMIDKWMEKKKKAIDHDKARKASSDLKPIKAPRKCSEKPRFNSSSSSSDYSFFSSSEAESLPVPRPKPVRTGCSGFEKVRERRASFGELGSERIPKQEIISGFMKTKSRALKIYGDLKKVRQPISPGGKLSAFLTSLFSNGGNLKKTAKVVSNIDDSPSLKSTTNTSSTTMTTTTCSSASSFSRTSCLSKTPSSTRKNSNNVNGVKRSVRFSSVSMIIDEGSKSYGHKRLDQDDDDSFIKCKKTSSDVEVSKDSNIRSVADHQELIMACVMEKKNHLFDQDSDEDDDASYASSDLFELDNLSSIGLMESSYRDELPVYETTRPENNHRVIAYEMIL